MDLVILAAGMGSRFGSAKQLEEVGPNGELIIDYSIYDAIKAGFNRIILIIREEHLDLFEEIVGKKWKDNVEIVYAFQSNEDLNIPNERTKPLGTLHAVLCASKYITNDFALLNSDDFYGYQTFKNTYDFLKNNNDSSCVVGYNIINTLSLNGSVNRALIKKNSNDDLISIEECLNIKIENERIYNDEHEFDKDDLVSLNFFGVRKNVLPLLNKYFDEFLKNADLTKDEVYFPKTVGKMIDNNECDFKVISSNEKWYGITYKEDLPEFKESILKLIDEGKYPKKLS